MGLHIPQYPHLIYGWQTLSKILYTNSMISVSLLDLSRRALDVFVTGTPIFPSSFARSNLVNYLLSHARWILSSDNEGDLALMLLRVWINVVSFASIELAIASIRFQCCKR